MDKSLENIHQLISSYIDIDEEEWLYYSDMFRVKEYKRKEFILNAGEIAKDVFFVDSGLLRVFFTDKDGNEKTFHFAQENGFVTDYESFLKRTPSRYSIQALEDTTTVLMSYHMLHDGYKHLKNGEKLGRLLAEDYFFLFSEKIRAIYTQTPLERYKQISSS